MIQLFRFYFTEFEVYLKAKIAEAHQTSNDEKAASCSDPNGTSRSAVINSKITKSLVYHPIDSTSRSKSTTSGSKVSVYFTPNDSIDQPQLQLSPMHINYIRENLDSYIGCLKSTESDTKFDFNAHHLNQLNLEKEIDHRRSQQFSYQSTNNDEDYDRYPDEVIEIDTEQTKMLNKTDENPDNNMTINSSAGCYIRMNTLPKRNKFKRNLSGNDFYYSLENVFDSNAHEHDSNFYPIHESNKTIDEASETQLTSSSDNCSSNKTTRLNQQNPSQSVLDLNEMAPVNFNDIQTSASMPNINESTVLTKEQSKNIEIDQNIVEMQINELDRKVF